MKTTPAIVKLSLVALFVFLAPNLAKADEVVIQGYTNGCFCHTTDPTVTPVNTPAPQTDTVLGLTFVNATFSGTTTGGFLALNSGPLAPPTQNVNNLGALFLSTTPATYLNDISVRVTFTAPEGIFGSLKGSLVFAAVIRGTVTSDPVTGGVTIDFGNTPTLLTFTDPNCGTTTVASQQTTCGMGTFSFSINPVSIQPGQLVALTGQITGAQQTAIPEPATMFLLGTGLLGVVAGLRKRRSLKE